MKTYLLILPVSFLVTYSQLMVKLRSNSIDPAFATGFAQQLYRYLSDPLIVSAYVSALLASFAWLFVVTKLPLTVAFPVYIGTTFAMVLLGGWYFLSEPLSAAKIVSVLLIFGGIILGVSADE